MNALTAIYPFFHEGLWVFDDPSVGLVREPFISGADLIIDRLTAHIPDARDGFRLLFSASRFPGYTAQLQWRRVEFDGNWYYEPTLDIEGWLCPARLKYFEALPKVIYAKVEPRIRSEMARTRSKPVAGTTPTGYLT